MQEIKKKIKLAQLNKERSKQIYENQTRRLNNLIKDAEEDEDILKNLEEEKIRESKQENKKRLMALHSKYIIQQQMKDRSKQREESKYEYMRDKSLVDNIVKQIAEEDLDALRRDKEKKELAKQYMEESYKEKEERRLKQKEMEKQLKEKEREYFESVAKRESEQKAKKQLIQDEKDRIFNKLSEEKRRALAEKEYWENVRNELYLEEQRRKDKIKELEELEKKQR